MRSSAKWPVDYEEELQLAHPSRTTGSAGTSNLRSMRNPAPPLFTGLPPAPRRRKFFLISFVAQAILLAILIKTGVLNPPAAVKKALGDYVTLVAPAPSTYMPPPKTIVAPPPVIARTQIPPPVAPLAQVVPPPKAPAPQVVEKPRPVETPKVAASLPAPQLPKTEKKVMTGTFSTGSTAKPNSTLPVQKVQTGGFGDPSGVVPNPNGSDKSKLAQVGSFDLPTGSGQGNGSGGSKGAVAVVASAGFGNGIATDTPSKGPGGGVHAGGFGDMAASAVPTAPAHHSDPAQGKLTPAEITSKPNPVYTEEARRLKIEGEVLLKVNFTVSGKVEVLWVVRGLGHGLDEAAVRAAEGMRFKPAMRDGKPVDSMATVHVLFQLT